MMAFIMALLPLLSNALRLSNKDMTAELQIDQRLH